MSQETPEISPEPHDAPRPSRRPWRRGVFIAVPAAVALLAAVGIETVVMRGRSSPPAEHANGADVVPVTSVRPKYDPNFYVVASNPGYVYAYYRVDLEAQVPGVVDPHFTRDVGDHVTAGEAVLQLTVPDLVSDVKVKDAMIAAKRNEQKVYEKRKKLAAAAVDTATALAKEAQQNVVVANADLEYRRQRAQRFEGLVNQQAAIPDVAAETLAESKKAQAVSVAAVDAVARAQAEIAEASAKLEAADADIELKKSEIDQAVAERDKAQATLDFATLKAPFDGVVVRRMVDPGSFVAKSSSGHSDALVTLERTDVLTVRANFPDTYARWINTGTKVRLNMTELPDVVIEGAITRLAPTLQTPDSDRTMLVEVDLFNGTAAEYEAFKKKAAVSRDGLKGGALPLFPVATKKTGEAAESVHLIPGMFGTMSLVLNDFPNAYLLPASAVFSRGGLRYVYLVKEDGKAVLTRVRVQVENGKQIKAQVVVNKDGQETTRELGPDDEIVNSNQGELRDGQTVKANPVPW